MNIADRSGPSLEMLRHPNIGVWVDRPNIDSLPKFPCRLTPSWGYYATLVDVVVGTTLTWVVSGYRLAWNPRSGEQNVDNYMIWWWTDQQAKQLCGGSNELCELGGPDHLMTGSNGGGMIVPGHDLFCHPDLKIVYRLRIIDKDNIGWSAAPIYAAASQLDAGEHVYTETDVWVMPRSIGWGFPPPVLIDPNPQFYTPDNIIIHSFTRTSS